MNIVSSTCLCTRDSNAGLDEAAPQTCSCPHLTLDCFRKRARSLPLDEMGCNTSRHVAVSGQNSQIASGRPEDCRPGAAGQHGHMSLPSEVAALCRLSMRTWLSCFSDIDHNNHTSYMGTCRSYTAMTTPGQPWRQALSKMLTGCRYGSVTACHRLGGDMRLK